MVESNRKENRMAVKPREIVITDPNHPLLLRLTAKIVQSRQWRHNNVQDVLGRFFNWARLLQNFPMTRLNDMLCIPQFALPHLLALWDKAPSKLSDKERA